MDAEPKRNLIQKAAAVMGAVERVPKNGHNNFHNYDYSTEADILAAVRKEMAIQGLLLIPSVKSVEWKDLTRAKGGVDRLATMTVDFTLTDGEEERVFTVLGEGTDSGDKATYKGMTGAMKYALLKLFLIPTGDDPEKDDEDEPPPRRQSRPAPQSVPRPQAPTPPRPQGNPEPTDADKAKALVNSNRDKQIFEDAKATGIRAADFHGWAETVLGRPYGTNQDWAEIDRRTLEGEIGIRKAGG